MRPRSWLSTELLVNTCTRVRRWGSEMERTVSAEPASSPSLKERVKRYIIYAILLIACAILLYVFVWFGTQLGLQG